MAYSTPNTSSLQSLLFDTGDFGSCFFREPSERELEFLGLYATVQRLLSPGELTRLRRGSIKGRVGYDPYDDDDWGPEIVKKSDEIREAGDDEEL